MRKIVLDRSFHHYQSIYVRERSHIMSELKEFTALEMQWCPIFEYELDNKFLYVAFDTHGAYIKSEYKDKIFTSVSLRCRPLDRCHAICRQLFDLMPQVTTIRLHFGDPKSPKLLYEIKTIPVQWIDLSISINPFLHTDLTSITREQVINEKP